jgi:hypothetical protein
MRRPGRSGFGWCGAKLTWEQLKEQAPLPCGVVVYKIKKEPGVYVAGKLAPVQNSPSFRVKKVSAESF